MTAKVLADSITLDGYRLTTLEVRFHRFVLAEFNTHRVFSRNSASSRAIPVTKQIERVRKGPALPFSWPAEQRGMQGGAALREKDLSYVRRVWEGTASYCASVAEELHAQGLHKSVTNRLLEPFMWHTAVVTSTAWDNFFAQRCSPLAQPEIRAAAEAMKVAVDESDPDQLDPGEWHLPYVTDDEREDVATADLVKVAAARCARVSYLTQDGRHDPYADLELYDRLVSADPPHWSPLEHVATPWPENRQSTPIDFTSEQGIRLWAVTKHLPRVGNLVGWRSLRTEVECTRGEVTFR